MPKTNSNKNSLKDLGRILIENLSEIRKENNEKAKEIAFEVLRIAVRHTKIDTSKAKSNWQVSLDRPITTEREAFFKGKKGSTIEQSTVATIGTGVDVIRDKQPGVPIFIVNNIDYTEVARVDKARDEAVEEGLILVQEAKSIARNS